MPIRYRPVKSAGNQNFADEVTDGVPDIIDTELDADANTLYTLVNGQIDDDNINSNPYLAWKKIAYPKLNLTGQIQQSDLVPGFTVPPGTVTGGPGGQIAPGSITMLDMALFASCVTGTPVSQARTDVVGLDMGPGDAVGAEQVLCSVEWTTRLGPFFADSEVRLEMLGDVSNSANHMSAQITVRLRWDHGSGDPTTGAVLWQRVTNARDFAHNPALSLFGQFIMPINFTVPFWGSFVVVTGDTASLHRLTLTSQLNVGGSSRPININHTASSLVVAELA